LADKTRNIFQDFFKKRNVFWTPKIYFKECEEFVKEVRKSLYKLPPELVDTILSNLLVVEMIL
jgi:hypothetical protein